MVSIHPSPFFGEMDHAQALRLQLALCGHHLDFLRGRESK
jgi:hypothetical protein